MPTSEIFALLERACVDFDGFAAEFPAYLTVNGFACLNEGNPIDALTALCAYAQTKPSVLANLIRDNPDHVARWPRVRDVQGVDAALALALSEDFYAATYRAVREGPHVFPREAFFLVGAAMCVAKGAAGTQQWLREYVEGRKRYDAN